MTTPAEPTVARDRDPVCGMSVRVDVAVEDGLVADHDGQTYHFCRAGCRDDFLASPGRYLSPHGHVAEPAHAPTGAPVIDDGLRLWYESCSCCLSDAFPDVKAALDAEREAAAEQPAGPGICEVAEASEETPEPTTV